MSIYNCILGGAAYLVDHILGGVAGLLLGLETAFLSVCTVGNSLLDAVLAGHLVAFAAQILGRVLLLQRVGLLGRLALSSRLGRPVDRLDGVMRFLRRAQIFFRSRLLNSVLRLI